MKALTAAVIVFVNVLIIVIIVVSMSTWSSSTLSSTRSSSCHYCHQSGFPASLGKARVIRIWKLDVEMGGDGSYIFSAT
eukprot:12184369-Karenia_brevis.AAC.1